MGMSTSVELSGSEISTPAKRSLTICATSRAVAATPRGV